MPRFKRLTIEEARTLSRDELFDRIESEQAYWMRQWPGFDPEGFKVFREIMYAAVDPGKAIAETWALLEGRPIDEGYFTRPLGERGEL